MGCVQILAVAMDAERAALQFVITLYQVTVVKLMYKH